MHVSLSRWGGLGRDGALCVSGCVCVCFCFVFLGGGAD